VIQRKTQTAEYWQAFTLNEDDVEHLHSMMVEAEEPLTTRELALGIVAERVRREESELKVEITKGALYQPKNSYAEGDRVIFPAFDFRLGRVTGVRSGHNPEYGEFQVVTVDFGPDRRQRSFAAGLAAPHKLNVDLAEVLNSGDQASPEKLLETVAGSVPQALVAQLSQHPRFAVFEDRWLLRDLLAEVHVGHLNIAEALIEMRGQPVDTDVLTRELELPAEIKPEVLAFSVQSALAADGRFDQVGDRESRRWFLRRLEPAESLETPLPLIYLPIQYDRNALSVELMQLEWELDDEWTDTATPSSAVRSTIATTTLLLTYPHLASGTLPLSNHSRPFFPTGHGERTMVTLIDGRWGARFPAWVVSRGRYVAGLRSWFEEHKLPAGAYIVLERRTESGEIVVDFRPKRMRREWARMAQVTEEGRLDFQMRKQAITCEFDEHVIIGVEDRGQSARQDTL